MTATPPKTAKPRVTVAKLQEDLAASHETVRQLSESFHDLQLQWEDRHWKRLIGGGPGADVDGLRLDSIKAVSKDLRLWVTAGFLKRIIEVRGDTIYGDGVGFKNFKKAKTAFESPNNMTKLFSVEALQEINRAHGTDGTVVFLVRKSTKEITRFFLEDMGEPYVDGNDQERIWYVRRSWNRVTPSKPEGEDVERFYATDTCPPAMASKASVNVGGGQSVKIDRDYTAVVWDVNKQGGWALGIPDLVAALPWAERYTGYLKNQDKFAEALASIAWEYSAGNVDQAKKMTATLATEQVAGAAVHGQGGELRPMGGNSDVVFTNGEPMAAAAAALGGITVDALLAKQQTAAAATMDPNVKKMAAARRQSASSFFKRIGRLLGAPNLEVIWPDMETESPFREAQMIIAATDTGLFDPEEVRPALAQRIRIPLAEGSSVPSGYLQPNNRSSLPRRDIDADGAGGTSSGANNGQGKDALGVGKLSNDTRDSNTARDKGEV